MMRLSLVIIILVSNSLAYGSEKKFNNNVKNLCTALFLMQQGKKLVISYYQGKKLRDNQLRDVKDRQLLDDCMNATWVSYLEEKIASIDVAFYINTIQHKDDSGMWEPCLNPVESDTIIATFKRTEPSNEIEFEKFIKKHLEQHKIIVNVPDREKLAGLLEILPQYDGEIVQEYKEQSFFSMGKVAAILVVLAIIWFYYK